MKPLNFKLRPLTILEVSIKYALHEWHLLKGK